MPGKTFEVGPHTHQYISANTRFLRYRTHVPPASMLRLLSVRTFKISSVFRSN